jgi:hypothetical protein
VLEKDDKASASTKATAQVKTNKISSLVDDSDGLLEQAGLAAGQASARSGELETA